MFDQKSVKQIQVSLKSEKSRMCTRTHGIAPQLTETWHCRYTCSSNCQRPTLYTPTNQYDYRQLYSRHSHGTVTHLAIRVS